MKSAIITILILGAVAGLLYFYWFDWRSAETRGDENVFCTLDAKLCPDGSYVGRVPPTCEFAMCPNPTNATSSATTTPDDDIYSTPNAS